MRPTPARLTPLALALSMLALAPPAWPQVPARNLSVAPAAAAATQARRVALVIGNNRYPSAPLLNPVNDARAMAKSLEAAGFQVILRTDANQREMLAAVREFGSRLKDSGAGLFYFAGHGMQIKGRNYLIPVGADIEREDEVAYQAMDAQAVLDKMESAGNGTNLMILDACRNNPFARSFRSASQGLAQMDAPVGTMVAFSTAPGSVASDGQGSNGLYTQHLLGALQQPGLKVEEVFKQVRGAVRRESQGRQVPWESTSLEGDFYFVQPQAPVAATPPPDPLATLDDALWGAVKDGTEAADVQAYLRRFPQGRHAAEAALRLQALTPAAITTAQLGGAPALLATGPAALSAGPGPLAAVTVAALAPALYTPPLPPSAPPPAVSAFEPLPEIDAADSARNERAIAESNRRIGEIVRWGDEDTDQRPAQPQRNAFGFSQGDRWRWSVLDRMRNEFVDTVFLRLDGIEYDGSLRGHDGRAAVDARGNIISLPSAKGLPAERWVQPPRVADMAALPEGSSRSVEAVLDTGNGRVSFSGNAQRRGTQRLKLKSGEFDAVRVDVTLVAGGGSRTRSISLWYAAGLGLPLAWEQDDRIDGRLDRRLRLELLAYDVQTAPLRMADLTTGR